MADANVRYKVSQVGAEKVASSFKKIGTSILASFGGVIALQGIIRLTKGLKDAARDGEETRNKFDVIFSSIVEGANRMADAFSEKFKLAGVTTRQLLGNTGDLLVGFGFTEKAALDMALQVAELSQDLVSLTNFEGGTTRAVDALTRALLGETESVKSLGISILQEDVKLKIFELTQKGVTFETERQAKAIATLEIAFDQTQKAQGDAINTMGFLAAQERVLDERLKELSETLGQDLTGGFNDATGAAIVAVDVFSDFNEIIKDVTGSLGNSVGVLGALIKLSFLPINIVLSVTSGDAFTIKFWEKLLGFDGDGGGFKFNFDENVFVGATDGFKKINSEVDITRKRLKEIIGLIKTQGLTFEELHELIRERNSLEEQLKLPIIEVNELLETRLSISRQLVASSEEFLRASGSGFDITGAQGGRRGGRATGVGGIFGSVASKKMVEDAGKVGEQIFDGWANVLTSNMNTAWAEIFGEANSLFEQLVNSMADLLIKNVFSQLISFIPGGGVLGFIGDLFSNTPTPSPITQTLNPGRTPGNQTIILQMGSTTLGEWVLEGNRQIQQRRLV